MKTKLIGIFICTLLIATAIPVIGQVKDISISKDNDEIYPLLNGDKWIKTFGGTEYDNSWDGQQTADGGYIIVGGTESYASVGKCDIWLIKTDTKGNKQWDKIFGGPDNDWGLSVKQTTDGGYILACKLSFDSWLIKTDADGNIEWDKILDKYGVLSVRQTTDEGFILTGYKNLLPPQGYDILLLKADSDGNEMWNKTYGGIGPEMGFSVQQTNDGGYILTGGYYKTCSYLIKTDSNGDEEWIKTFGSNMEGRDVLQTSNGGYTVVGRKGEEWPNTGWMIRTDEDGDIVSQEKYCGLIMNYIPMSLFQTSDGGYIITGSAHVTLEHVLSSYLWLAKTDEYGKIQWEKIFGGFDPFDHGSAVQQTTDGGYIIVGSTNSYGAGGVDIWLIKTDAHGNVPRNRATYNSLFLWFLEQFPILQKILSYIL
ncbi:MAG: hypothetical protein ACFFDT_25225 [Candidatus Hodarchaeota archaeon]